MKDQRIKEDRLCLLIPQVLRRIMPFKHFVKFLREIKVKLDGHKPNSGYDCIFGRHAQTYKSTMCEILAISYGAFHTWPGSQFVYTDILKYDDAARAQIDSILIVEMKWLNLQKKITLNDTLCSIKEQLSGSGLNIRLAKNILDGLKLKLVVAYKDSS